MNEKKNDVTGIIPCSLVCLKTGELGCLAEGEEREVCRELESAYRVRPARTIYREVLEQRPSKP